MRRVPTTPAGGSLAGANHTCWRVIGKCQPHLLVGHGQVPTTPAGGPLAADSHTFPWGIGQRVRTVIITPVGGSLTE